MDVEAFLGEIRLFAGYGYRSTVTVPNGWLPCDGRSVKISDYQALYSLIGTIYGGSSTTFNLPDLRQRVPIGMGQGTGLTNRVLGTTGGAAQVAVTEGNLPVHQHTANVSTSPATTPVPGSTLVPAAVASGQFLYAKPASAVTTPGIALSAAELQTEGGGAAHANMMPTSALTYMIAMVGIYPVNPN